jgi:hypothetical protein
MQPQILNSKSPRLRLENADIQQKTLLGPSLCIIKLSLLEYSIAHDRLILVPVAPIICHTDSYLLSAYTYFSSLILRKE